MLNKNRNPYARDVFLAYLIKGAKRTSIEGYPVIERDMVCTEAPKDVAQWDCRSRVKEPSVTGMSFYCVDDYLSPILNNPKKYLEMLKKYHCVLGMDASPNDNMPLVVQKSQIYNNLAITYYFGKNGLKIIPNVRLGVQETSDSLAAYPRKTLISIGTNGFIKNLVNREIFREQVDLVVSELSPTGIIVYGPVKDKVFASAINKNIPIYQYNSYMMNRNKLLAKRGRKNERELQ